MTNEKKPDLVYILGTGSHWRNNEIRYSLRSVQKYLPHGKVFIIGYKPKWARNVIHIPCPDPYRNKLQNSIFKTKKAAWNPEISDRFVIMNDDFFFLRPTKKVKVYYRGTMDDSIREHPTQRGYYFSAMTRTRAMLRGRGFMNPKDYAVHFPMILEKKKVRRLISQFPFDDEGYLFRTVYANVYGLGGYPRTDTKIKKVEELRKRKITRGPDLISTTDGIVLDPKFQKWIHKRLPEPSPYEIEGIEDDMYSDVAVTRYHTPGKFTYGSRTYGKGEIVKGPIPQRIVKINGLIPIRERIQIMESGGVT